MRMFLPFALVALLAGGVGTQAFVAEKLERLLEPSNTTLAANTDAQAASNPLETRDASNAASSAPKAAPASSNSTSTDEPGSKSASNQPPVPSEGGGGSSQPKYSSGGGGEKDSPKGAKKYSSGSFAAPVAAPTTAPKKDVGGSFMQPVAAPASADDPVPVTHATTATDDDDVNATIGGASSTPGNSEPLAHHVYKPVSKNSTIILPEGDQPKHWPEFLVVIFTVATIVLCGIAVKRSCSKRRKYEEVPTTLIV